MAVITNHQINQMKNGIFTEFKNQVTHIAVGSGTTTPTTSDTTLATETYREATFEEEVKGNLFAATLFLDETENNGNNIREAGMFNASSGGTMYTRKLTNLIEKDSNLRAFIEPAIKINFG